MEPIFPTKLEEQKKKTDQNQTLHNNIEQMGLLTIIRKQKLKDKEIRVLML